MRRDHDHRKRPTRGWSQRDAVATAAENGQTQRQTPPTTPSAAAAAAADAGQRSATLWRQTRQHSARERCQSGQRGHDCRPVLPRRRGRAPQAGKGGLTEGRASDCPPFRASAARSSLDRPYLMDSRSINNWADCKTPSSMALLFTGEASAKCEQHGAHADAGRGCTDCAP